MATEKNLQEAEKIKLEGNQLFSAEKYQEAVVKYSEAIKLNPKLDAAWFNRGVAHKKLKQYADALDDFEETLTINPAYIKATQQKEYILQLLTTHSHSDQDANFYIEDIFRPLICKEEYLNKIKKIQKFDCDDIKKLDFSEQITYILYLIDFLRSCTDFTKTPNACIQDILLSQTREGRRARLHIIGNKILGAALPPNFMLRADEIMLNLLHNLHYGIILEDAKQTLRRIFETMYCFPREERGKLIDFLPWNDNSWYLFDFCGSIFINDDAIDKESGDNGISIMPYKFNDNQNKQHLLQLYQKSLIDHTAIVKIAILDIVKYDIPTLGNFFQSLFNFLTSGDKLNKMADLPHLRTLLWYIKQTYNIQRLLCLLPAVPGNNFDPAEKASIPGARITATSNTDQAIDLVKFLSSQQFKDSVPDKMKQQVMLFARMFQASGRKITMQDLIDAEIINPSAISYGVEETNKTPEKVFNTADFMIGSNNQSIPLAKRLLLSSANSYLNFNTLKGRLAFLRKLQLIGEIFIPRNWGNHLQYVDYIDPERLSKIRNGLTHIEDHRYIDAICSLENDQKPLKMAFREFQTLKEQAYEETVKRQEHFPIWPEDEGIFKGGFSSWEPFASHYWNKTKEYYQLDSSLDNFIPHKPLLAQEKIDAILAVFNNIEQSKKDIIEQCLLGKLEFPNTKESLNKLLPLHIDKKTRKFFEEAGKTYRKFKTDKKKSNEQKNASIKNNRKAMDQTYPVLVDFSQKFCNAEDKLNAAPDKKELFNILKNRIKVLRILMNESLISADNKRSLQEDLHNLLQRDMAFLLSISYVLVHIFGLLNKLYTLTNLNIIDASLTINLPKYLALRNYLGHTDPILESIELPYYHMVSDAPKMMAVTVGEIIFDYSDKIFAFDPFDLPDTAKSVDLAIEGLKQSHAIDPKAYVFASSTADEIPNNTQELSINNFSYTPVFSHSTEESPATLPIETPTEAMKIQHGKG